MRSKRKLTILSRGDYDVNSTKTREEKLSKSKQNGFRVFTIREADPPEVKEKYDNKSKHWRNKVKPHC